MLTWSFGWTGDFDPSSPPASSIARFEMTSLAFMFVCVPLPVCQTLSGKCSSSLRVCHLACRLLDQLGDRRVELPELGVGPRRRLFQYPDRPQQRAWHDVVADREVNQGARRLGSPVAVRREPRSDPSSRSRCGSRSLSPPAATSRLRGPCWPDLHESLVIQVDN